MFEHNSSYLWQPSTQMGTIAGKQEIIVKGNGAYITTKSGVTAFDASAALWYANFGHAHPEIVSAAQQQLQTLETFQIWGNYLNDKALELAGVLATEISPIPNPKVIFGAGGSDSDEIAFKLARLHWQLNGKPNKKTILSREKSYHGLHAFGASLRGDLKLRKEYGTDSLVPETGIISTTDLEKVKKTVTEIGAENIAAIVVEPIIATGGLIAAGEEYLKGLRQLADENQILLIFDEVVTGFGRTGHWFAADRYGVVPDILTFAKGVTAGYFPLSGLFIAEKIWEPFWSKDEKFKFNFGITYSGHATGCAIALKVIELIKRDGILARVQELERLLDSELAKALAGIPAVKAYRCEGFLAMIDFDPEQIDNQLFSRRLLHEYQILVRPVADKSLAISPPFISSDEEVKRLVSSIAELAKNWTSS